ncbi:MAG: hypothetical protein IJC45_02135 [Clostridia bacterium]|nr:hypothetical protein [Clostridia bacterium]
MKRLHKIICLLLIVAMAAPLSCLSDTGIVPTASALQTSGYYVALDDLQMFSLPSDVADLVYFDTENTLPVTVPFNTHLLVSEINGNYGKTLYHGIEGWVSLTNCDYIRGFVMPTESHSAMIDISSHNATNNFDWAKLRASGITGVIIRIGGRYAVSDGTGAIYADPSLLIHYNAAKRAGMAVGFYFFSYAMTREGAVEEAQYCLDIIRNNNLVADLPIFFDLEDYNGDPVKPHANGGKQLNNMLVQAFCSTIENAGFYAGVYMNKSFRTDMIDDYVLANRAFWLAHYMVPTTYTGPYDLWQYTDKGIIDGYSNGHYLDLNHCYKDYTSFIRQYGFNGFEMNNSTGSDGHVHKYSTPIISYEATCEQDGLQTIYCTTCNEILETELLPKVSHKIRQAFVPEKLNELSLNTYFSEIADTYYDLSVDEDIIAAYNVLQTQGGTIVNYCANCNAVTSIMQFDAQGECQHSFSFTPAKYVSNVTLNYRSGPATSFEPLKNENNTTLYVRAGDTFEVLYTLGKWAYTNYNGLNGWASLEWSSIQSEAVYENEETIAHPDCDSDGLISVSCEDCEKIVYSSVTSCLGHAKGDSVHTTGTCMSNGNKTIHCQICETLLLFTIDERGEHRYEQAVTKQPTEDEHGIATYTCSVCDDIRTISLPSLYMFDVTGQEGCDSSDARIALRCAVGLEDITAKRLSRLDIDNSGDLTVTDARLLLRLSVRLENEHEILIKYFEIKSS